MHFKPKSLKQNSKVSFHGLQVENLVCISYNMLQLYLIVWHGASVTENSSLVHIIKDPIYKCV